MKRWQLSILGIVVIVLVAVGILWKLAPKLVSDTLSNKMQVAVNIDAISLSGKAITVSKISVANPKDTLLPKALTVGAITVLAPLTHFFKDQIIIDKIELNDIYVDIEMTTSSSPSGNWAQIFANMKSSSSPSTPAKAKEGSLLIKQLILTNITGDIVVNPLLGTSKKLTPIDRLEFSNLSSEAGATAAHIAQLILEKTIAGAMQEESPQNPLQNAWQNLKELVPK